MKFWRHLATFALVMLLTMAFVFTPFTTASSLALFGKKAAGRSAQKSSLSSSIKISEVSPPELITELKAELEEYQPQVSILSPRADEVVQDVNVSVRFQVKDLPIFKDKKLGLGPHLHVLLDNRTYQPVYDLEQPLVFENLEPGTHTIRAIASRPWHESFKNEGAFAQVTFHIFAKTGENSPDPALPLLTYSRPQGSYGAEPIMLDYYLTNAPLHLVAQADDEIADWRIRVTVNGNSFILDSWQPIYLKGFRPGKNWVQIEYLDEQGNPVKNVFNNTVRLVEYQPGGQDTLSQLVRGELTIADVKGIVDPNYTPPAPPPTAEPAPIPILTPEPAVAPAPPSEATPTPEVQPSSAPASSPRFSAPATNEPTAKKSGSLNRQPPEDSQSEIEKPQEALPSTSLQEEKKDDRLRLQDGQTQSPPAPEEANITNPLRLEQSTPSLDGPDTLPQEQTAIPLASPQPNQKSGGSVELRDRPKKFEPTELPASQHSESAPVPSAETVLLPSSEPAASPAKGVESTQPVVAPETQGQSQTFPKGQTQIQTQRQPPTQSGSLPEEGTEPPSSPTDSSPPASETRPAPAQPDGVTQLRRLFQRVRQSAGL